MVHAQHVAAKNAFLRRSTELHVVCVAKPEPEEANFFFWSMISRNCSHNQRNRRLRPGKIVLSFFLSRVYKKPIISTTFEENLLHNLETKKCCCCQLELIRKTKYLQYFFKYKNRNIGLESEPELSRKKGKKEGPE